MSKKKRKFLAQPTSGHLYVHEKSCFPLDRLFKKHLVEAISRRIEDGHAVFMLHETYSAKHGVEKQHGGRWKLSDRNEVVRAIELAKKRKDVMLVEEAG